MDRVKIARIPDEIFYDDQKMLKVQMGSYDNKLNDLAHY